MRSLGALRALCALLPLPAWSAVPVPVAAPATACETAAAYAEQHARLPRGVLLAIAQVESGRPNPETGRLRPWPWTINAEGAGEFFASKQQAIAAVRRLQQRGVRSIDVGCMQVNLSFHPAAFTSLEQAFDPAANAAYAARFLSTLHAGTHDWPAAIAAYHSATPVLGDDYRQRVMALWRQPDRAGWQLGLAVAYRAFAPQEDIYADFPPVTRTYGAFAPPGAR